MARNERYLTVVENDRLKSENKKCHIANFTVKILNKGLSLHSSLIVLQIR